MVLAVSAAVFAITNNAKSAAVRCLVSAILIAVVLALYQLTVSVFVGLCVVEFVWNVRNKKPVNDVLSVVVTRAGELMAGCLIYFFSAFQLASDERGRLLPLNMDWWESVSTKLLLTMNKVMLLFNLRCGWSRVYCW
jgi:hypothetical protein